jgi:hypothetical protein
MYEGTELLGRLAWAMKSIFFVCIAILGLSVVLPLNILLPFSIAAAAVATLSIAFDIIRGGRVVLWTLLMLAGGAAILGLFYWIHLSFTRI